MRHWQLIFGLAFSLPAAGQWGIDSPLLGYWVNAHHQLEPLWGATASVIRAEPLLSGVQQSWFAGQQGLALGDGKAWIFDAQGRVLLELTSPEEAVLPVFDTSGAVAGVLGLSSGSMWTKPGLDWLAGPACAGWWSDALGALQWTTQVVVVLAAPAGELRLRWVGPSGLIYEYPLAGRQPPALLLPTGKVVAMAGSTTLVFEDLAGQRASWELPASPQALRLLNGGVVEVELSGERLAIAESNGTWKMFRLPGGF